MKVQIHADQISLVIRLAWEDRTTFEEIKTRTGLAEHEVIDIMRRELKPSSFAMWRKRVAGRVTKHRKLLERRLKSPSRTFSESEEDEIEADEPKSKDPS
ncbi:MAG: TIGR03643 family protein [Chthoniobacterales bacterium]